MNKLDWSKCAQVTLALVLMVVEMGILAGKTNKERKKTLILLVSFFCLPSFLIVSHAWKNKPTRHSIYLIHIVNNIFVIFLYFFSRFFLISFNSSFTNIYQKDGSISCTLLLSTTSTAQSKCLVILSICLVFLEVVTSLYILIRSFSPS